MARKRTATPVVELPADPFTGDPPVVEVEAPAVEGFSLAGEPDGSVTPVLVEPEVVLPEVEPEPVTPPTPIERARSFLTSDPNGAAALFRLVRGGRVLATWEDLGANRFLRDMGTGLTLAMVSPDGRGFIIHRVDGDASTTEAQGLASMEEGVARASEFQRARGVYVLP